MEESQNNLTLPEINVSDKIIQGTPSGFRLFKQADGTTVLQSSHQWTSLNGTGIDWVDVPTVSDV